MNRRDVLASVGVMGTVGVAGCLDAVPFLGSETKLGRLAVVNWDEDDTHTIDVRVERGGTVVHESTHTVGKMEGNTAQSAVPECTWDDVAGEYVVAARVAGTGNWRRFDLLEAAQQSPDCLIAAVQYGRLSGIDEARPLNIEVRDRCDEIGENYEGGCPAYLPNA